jgi:periplasmic divalent cation tolerance protein
MQIYFVYITARDESEALVIGRTLVEERLAACINVLPAMKSVYWWEGELEQSSEAVLIAKTHQGLVPELIERVKRLHSYACPAIVAWPVQTGHQPYLDWIEKETR